jgi:hypothetical protein
MLALTDSGLAYLVLAASRMPVLARDRWLLAQKLDPLARARQCKWMSAFGPLCGLKADNSLGPRSARTGRSRQSNLAKSAAPAPESFPNSPAALTILVSEVNNILEIGKTRH